jgi:hypothetical protein
MLPNGNILTMETCEGHKIAEITRDKKTLWRMTPHAVGNKNCVNPISAGKRIPYEFFDSDFIDQPE